MGVNLASHTFSPLPSSSSISSSSSSSHACSSFAAGGTGKGEAELEKVHKKKWGAGERKEQAEWDLAPALPCLRKASGRRPLILLPVLLRGARPPPTFTVGGRGRGMGGDGEKRKRCCCSRLQGDNMEEEKKTTAMSTWGGNMSMAGEEASNGAAFSLIQRLEPSKKCHAPSLELPATTSYG